MSNNDTFNNMQKLNNIALNKIGAQLKQNEMIDNELKRLNENRARLAEWKKQKSIENAAKVRRRNSEQY